MSTLTNNFNFFKPDLADPADITELNANWDRIDTELANAENRIVVATSTDGISYEATVPHLNELYSGLEITIIPNMSSTVNNPTLNVNNLGAKSIRLPLSINTNATTIPKEANFYGKDKPVKLMYNAGYAPDGAWQTVDKQQTSAQDLYGIVPVENGGTGANNPKEARQNLGAITLTPVVVTLTASDWAGTIQTIPVSGVTADNHVVVTHAPDSYTDYVEYRVRLYGQGDGTLTFHCDFAPTVPISVNILILE